MGCSQKLDGLPAVDVSIVVVSYNTAEMTCAALSSVADETIENSYELIVVDNASSDGSAAAIAEAAPNATLIASPHNLGFAAANNLAVMQARGRYVLLLNPDTVVTKAAIDKLVAFAGANQHAKIWGGRTVFADGRLNPASCWSRMTVWNLFCRTVGLTALLPHSEWTNNETFGTWQRDTVRHVDIVSGCFLLIERDFWNRLGGFDPVFFMYGEEADLCLRAKALGARPMITPEAEIIHYGGASDTARIDKMVKLLAAKMSLIERHMTGIRRPVASRLLQAWPLTRALALSTASFWTRSEDTKAAAKTWQAVWSKRDAWSGGWQIDANAEHQTRISRIPADTVANTRCATVQGSPPA